MRPLDTPMKCLFFITLLIPAGCVHSQPQLRLPPSATEPSTQSSPQTQPSTQATEQALRDYLQLGPVVGRKVWQQLEQIKLYAGFPESQFADMCRPLHASSVGNLHVYSLPIMIGCDGLILVAKGGKLARATRWTDASGPEDYFDTTTDFDRQVLKAYIPGSARVRSPDSVEQP